jgi:hypothetical protein
MKQRIFTLIMMLALVIVTGSAFGQTNRTPYPGSTYDYRLTGVKVIADGPALIALSGTTAAYTVSSVLDQTAVPLANVSLDTYTVLTTSTELRFKVKFNLSETAGPKKLTVSITDGATNGCTNFIELLVTVQSSPALALTSITASGADEICQVLTATPLPVDNNAASLPQASLTNTFTFTVPATVTNISTYTYSFNFALTSDVAGLVGLAVAYSGPAGSSYSGGLNGSVTGATANGNHVFTVTFKTTTGLAPATLTGTIDSPSLLAGASVGGGTYVGTITGAPMDTKVVRTMPSIGSFD